MRIEKTTVKIFPVEIVFRNLVIIKNRIETPLVGAEGRSFVANEGENNHYVALHFAQDASGLRLTYIAATGVEISPQVREIKASNPSSAGCAIESSADSLQFTNPTPGNAATPYQIGGNDSDCGVLVALAADMIRNNYARRDIV